MFPLLGLFVPGWPPNKPKVEYVDFVYANQVVMAYIGSQIIYL
jgi:hypothetical protein